MKKNAMKSLRKIAVSAIATGLCLVAASYIWASPGPGAKDAQALDAALKRLASVEAVLPASASPAPGADVAARRQAAEAFFRAGLLSHDIMRDYAEPLAKKAQAYLKASLAYEEKPITRAYLGSSHLIAARDAKSVITKVKEVDDGLKEVDAAVKSDPKDIAVRAVRIESTIDLPPMFNRLDTVTADLGLLLDLYAKDKGALGGAYDPARLFLMKAREQDLRGKTATAEKYRQKASELEVASKGDK